VQNKAELKALEDRILEVLSESTNLLGDERAIAVLSQSRELSVDINQKQAIADKTALDIEAARRSYAPLSVLIAQMFFAVVDLAQVGELLAFSGVC
jgi:dynein heavy chain